MWGIKAGGCSVSKYHSLSRHQTVIVVNYPNRMECSASLYLHREGLDESRDVCLWRGAGVDDGAEDRDHPLPGVNHRGAVRRQQERHAAHVHLLEDNKRHPLERSSRRPQMGKLRLRIPQEIGNHFGTLQWNRFLKIIDLMLTSSLE